MPDQDRKPTGAQSLHRAAALLRALARRNQVGVRMSDVTAELGLERPTAHRLLKALIDEGLARQDPDTRRYYLGSFVYELGLLAEPHFPLREVAAPSLKHLALISGDTVFMAIRAGNDALCIDRHAGSFPVKAFTVDIGSRIPLGAGCGGLAILAALPGDEAAGIMARNASRLSGYTSLTPDELTALVSRTIEHGYALNRQRAPGVVALGVALRNSDGGVAGSISIAAIESRLPQERIEYLIGLIQIEVRKIEKALVFR